MRRCIISPKLDAGAVEQHEDTAVLYVVDYIDELKDLFSAHYCWQRISFARVDECRNNERLLQHMTKEEGDALSSHAALAAPASKCFGQVEQIVHDHLLVKVGWSNVRIVAEEVAQFTDVITDGHVRVTTDGEELGSLFQCRYCQRAECFFSMILKI